MVQRICAAIFVAALASTAAWTAPPPIIGDEGATVENLIREQKLVTVVLNSGARAVNLKITGIYEETLSATEVSGAPSPFMLKDIREIRVQKTQLDGRDKNRPASALTSDDRKVVDSATARAFEIFSTSRGNQVVKMQAAMALAASAHELRMDAQAYLRELMSGNDAPTATIAATMFWLVGDEPSGNAIENGLNSGNRQTKADAALLAGLTGNNRYLIDVRRLLNDPAPEIFPSAAKAIARLDDRDSLPALYDGIRALNENKGEASVVALTIMGGSEVHQRLLSMLPDARGNEWFRIVRVLHNLGDEQATELLKTNAINQPAFDRQTALILIEQNAPEAVAFMRAFLDKPLDPVADNLVYKGQVGIALYEAGDIQAKGIVQDVLGTSPNLIYARGRNNDQQFKEQQVVEIQTKVSKHIGNTLNREFVTLLAVPVQSPNPTVSVQACIAALQIANPEFGLRVREASR